MQISLLTAKKTGGPREKKTRGNKRKKKQNIPNESNKNEKTPFITNFQENEICYNRILFGWYLKKTDVLVLQLHY
jgi:hypothetical protein